MGAGHQRGQIKNLKFSEGGRAGNGVNSYAYVMKPLETPQMSGVPRALRLANTWRGQEVTYLKRTSKLCTSSHVPYPSPLLHLDVHQYHLSYSFTINWQTGSKLFS